MGTFEPHEDFPAIVIDNGSSTCRAGLAGEDIPSCIFSSLVGKRKNLLGEDEFFVGGALQENRELMALTYPIENGIVVNWEDMMKVWDYVFYSKLSVLTEEHPILISEPPLNPRGNREKMAQVLFENYRAPASFVAYQPMLTKQAIGLSRGLMVSIGEGSSHVAPIIDGFILRQAVRRLDCGGRDLTRHLQQLLVKQGYSFTTAHELEIVRELKEKYCYIPDGNKLSAEVQSCKLSDGSSIELDRKVFACPEILFKPDGVFKAGMSIAEMIFESINDTDIDNRSDLLNTICLSGGTTLCPGFAERLKKDMYSLSDKKNPIMKIWTLPKRQLHKWIGGSVLGALSSFNHMWITRQEYEEYGPHIFNLRCYGE
ncbi:actin-85C-like isoform X2 [Biomphalaria glabrata]|nr:actin-85C-like isoform X2 [Biomphalaria glabrata]